MFFINPFIYAGGGDFESIATVTVGSGGATSLTFSDIPSGYQHLQLRLTLLANTASGGGAQYGYLRFNSDSGNNYAWHNMYGSGSAVFTENGTSGNRIQLIYTDSATYVSAGVVDILDYGSTSKNKTVRRFTGRDFNGSGYIDIGSGLWMSTNAVTSLSVTAATNSFGQYSTAALYGVKAP
jgi:hypothetical protein